MSLLTRSGRGLLRLRRLSLRHFAQSLSCARLDLARRLLGTPCHGTSSTSSRAESGGTLSRGAVRLIGRFTLFEEGAEGRLLSDPVLKALCDAFLRRSGWMERFRWLARSLAPASSHSVI